MTVHRRKPGRGAADRLVLFSVTAAAVLFCVIIGATALCSLTLVARLHLTGYYGEGIRYLRESLPHSLLLTGCALLAFLAGNALLRRLSVRLCHALLALWLAAAFFITIGFGLQQTSDPAALMETAREFASGDFRDLTWGYYMGCPFQLGMVLFLELAMRLFPALDTNLLMQCLNCVCAVLSAGLLSALAAELFGEAERRAVVLLSLTCLPLLLFPVYVYGTLCMVMLCSAAFLLYARWLRTGRLSLLALACLLLAVACQAKQNAMIAQVALAILCALYGIRERDARPLLLALGSVALGALLGQAIVLQYELRSGIRLVQNESKLTWLVMGLQEGGARSGWYNGYVGRFFDRYLTREAQLAEVKADLAERLAYLASHPGYTAEFMKDKWFSQWLEPTASTIAHGMGRAFLGRYNGLAEQVYRPVTYVNQLILGYMNTWQKALYLLSAAGGCCLVRERRDARALARLILPVTVIGGFLFHQLFEAKSQYVFPYLIYLIPVAAHGLCRLGALAAAVPGRLRRKRRG